MVFSCLVHFFSLSAEKELLDVSQAVIRSFRRDFAQVSYLCFVVKAEKKLYFTKNIYFTLPAVLRGCTYYVLRKRYLLIHGNGFFALINVREKFNNQPMPLFCDRRVLHVQKQKTLSSNLQKSAALLYIREMDSGHSISTRRSKA